MLYNTGDIAENTGHCKCSVFWLKIQRRNFSQLLESGIDGFLQLVSPRDTLKLTADCLRLLLGCWSACSQHSKVHKPTSLMAPPYFPLAYFSFSSLIYCILSYCMHLCKPSQITSGIRHGINKTIKPKDMIISVYT